MEYQLAKPLTAKEIRAQVNLIQEVMKAVMKRDTHYGTIPGCKKPSLWKPGAEVLLTTFKISVEPTVEDLSTFDEARYRVTVSGIYRNDGAFVGRGIGECSSNEEKYKWRKAVCDQEWEETPTDRRREKWSANDGKPYKVKQVRTEIADVANTILKMAKKRAEIDFTLTATAASDIFTQDIEDMPEGYSHEEGQSGKTNVTEPQRKSQSRSSGKGISEAQVKRFWAIIKGVAEPAGVTNEILNLIYFHITGGKDENYLPDGKFNWESVTKDEYDQLCNMFQDGTWKDYYAKLDRDNA